jgi:DNA modification methylase
VVHRPSRKDKAPFNRTIQLSEIEIKNFSDKLLNLNKKIDFKKISQKIINQDLFDIIDFLPDSFVDLMIIDPPYNISKKFNRLSFKQMEINKYEEWLDSWLKKILRILKSVQKNTLMLKTELPGKEKRGEVLKKIGKTAVKISGSLQFLRNLLSIPMQ